MKLRNFWNVIIMYSHVCVEWLFETLELPKSLLLQRNKCAATVKLLL